MNLETLALELDEDIKNTLPRDRILFIEKALRECAAQAYDDAARDVQCFYWGIGSATCDPCDDCMQAARLRVKAAALRSRP